jgi:hypothetical protein
MKELPIACSLSGAELAQRLERWRALEKRALIGAERTAAGASQRYRADAAVETELRDLISLEGECCPFLEFRLERRDEELVLEVSGPPGADQVVAEFAAV